MFYVKWSETYVMLIEDLSDIDMTTFIDDDEIY